MTDQPARAALRFRALALPSLAVLILGLCFSRSAHPVQPLPWGASGFNERDPVSLLPPAPAPVRYGLLRLEIEPSDAFIALDGESLDKGVWLISMAPGLHYVSVRKEGFLTWTRRIGIGPGENLRISVQLEQEPPK